MSSHNDYDQQYLRQLEKTPVAEASETQQKVLALLPKFVAFLSFLCSLYIIWDVCNLSFTRTSSSSSEQHQHRKNKQRMYHRILLGISVSDCSASLAWFFTTWPIPPEVLPIWGAKGTQQTCTVQGFFAQMSVATVIYSGCLAVYYYLVIQRGWSQRQLHESRIEYVMHTIAIVFALATSIASVSLGLINPIGWDCWIASVPLDCNESWLHHGESTCIRGDNASLFQWIFFYIPLWGIILTVTAIMSGIVWKFRVQERRNETYRRSDVGLAHTRVLRSNVNKTRQLAWQGLAYVASFLAAWTFPTILRFTEVTGDQTVYYTYVMLSATFVPSQGIWNLIVYLRPRFSKVRAFRRRQRSFYPDSQLHTDEIRYTTSVFHDTTTTPLTSAAVSKVNMPQDMPEAATDAVPRNNFAELPLESNLGESKVGPEATVVARGGPNDGSEDSVYYNSRDRQRETGEVSVDKEKALPSRQNISQTPKQAESQFCSMSRISEFFVDIQRALVVGDGGAGVDGILDHDTFITPESGVRRYPRNNYHSNAAAAVRAAQDDDDEVPATEPQMSPPPIQEGGKAHHDSTRQSEEEIVVKLSLHDAVQEYPSSELDCNSGPGVTI